MVFGIVDMNFELGDMYSYTPDPIYALLALVKVECGKRRLVEIITDNTV